MEKVKVCSTTPLQDQIVESRNKLYQIALVWSDDEMLADDLVQETIIAGMKNYKQLRDESNMFGWICSIMKNNWYRHLRRQKKHDRINEQQENCKEVDLIKQVRLAVTGLTMDQRQVISLVDIGELSYCEVAQTLDMPAGTVISCLHSARKSLLKELAVDQNQKAPVRRIRMVKT